MRQLELQDGDVLFVRPIGSEFFLNYVCQQPASKRMFHVNVLELGKEAKGFMRFKIRSFTPMRKLFEACAEKRGCKDTDFQLFFDGRAIMDNHTAETVCKVRLVVSIQRANMV